MDKDQATPPPSAGSPDLRRHVSKGAANWAKETLTGLVTAVGTVLAGMVLVQLGLATEGQSFEFSVFSPYEFYKSFSGLVVQWSQFNEWILLTLGLVTALPALFIFRRWRRTRDEIDTAEDGRIGRIRSTLSSLKSVGAVGMLSALLFCAYLYQQYLWRVQLPVPEDQIGIAFTRQIGSTLARDELADKLRQAGHEGKVVMRDLPVTFDARDTDRAKQMARRIGADAVVIYRSGQRDVTQAAGRDLAQPPESFVAHIVFADPTLGVEVPVPKRGRDGTTQRVEFKTKEGIGVPRIEAGDLSRLMEAAAGILLYDKDRYLPAIAHLRNAISDEGKDESDPIVRWYLGNAYDLIDQPSEAAKQFDAAIASLQGKRLTLQQRLLLLKIYNARGRIHFFDDQVDEAETLLQKGVALREPIEKDRSALEDRNTKRRVHGDFGSAYLTLMDIAAFRKDEDALSLWRQRASDEAGALLGMRGDSRARTDGTFLTYRAGNCSKAYKIAAGMLKENPRDIYAHRMVARIAALRSSQFTNHETKIHVEEILEIDPSSLVELQSLLNFYAIKMGFEDPGFIEQEREIVDDILEVDPSNAEALAEIVSSHELYAGFDLAADAGTTLFPLGHEPTHARVQAARKRDPAVMQDLISFVAKGRPYATRWSQEVDTKTTEPLIATARLSGRPEFWLYNFVSVEGLPPETTTQLKDEYEDVFARAVAEAERVLSSKRERRAHDELQANILLAEYWSHRLFYREGSPLPTEEVAKRVVTHGERALALTEQLTSSPDDTTVATSSLISLIGSFNAARVHFAQAGDLAEASRLTSLAQRVTTAFGLAAAKTVADTSETEEFLARQRCGDESDLLRKAQEAGRTAGTEEEVKIAERAVKLFPGDPEARLALGWAQFKSGSLEEAKRQTAVAERTMPEHPYPSSNLAVIAASEGDGAQAETKMREALGKLDRLPLGSRMNHLASIGVDLVELGRSTEKARPALAPMLSLLKSYTLKQVEASKGASAGLVVDAASNVAAAAIWSGDFDESIAIYEELLEEVNPDAALARANLGLARLGSGDDAGAVAEYEKAISATQTYLNDPSGVPLEGEAREARLELARQELQSSASVIPEFVRIYPRATGTGLQIVQRLASAIAALQ